MPVGALATSQPQTFHMADSSDEDAVEMVCDDMFEFTTVSNTVANVIMQVNNNDNRQVVINQGLDPAMVVAHVDQVHQHAERVQLCVRLYLVRQGCPRPVSFPVLPALRVYVRPTQEETRSIYP